MLRGTQVLGERGTQPPDRRNGSGPGAQVKIYQIRPDDNDHAQEGAWRQRAACRRVSIEIMYPEDRASATGRKLTGDALDKARDQALGVCAGCSVSTECLAYALAYNESVGIWGGALPERRRALRRELRQAREQINAEANWAGVAV